MQITKKYLHDLTVAEIEKISSENIGDKTLSFICGRINMLKELLDYMENDIDYENMKRWFAGEK